MDLRVIFRMVLTILLGHCLLSDATDVQFHRIEKSSNKKVQKNLGLQNPKNGFIASNVSTKFDNITLNVGEASIVKIDFNRIMPGDFLVIAIHCNTFMIH